MVLQTLLHTHQSRCQDTQQDTHADQDTIMWDHTCLTVQSMAGMVDRFPAVSSSHVLLLLPLTTGIFTSLPTLESTVLVQWQCTGALMASLSGVRRGGCALTRAGLDHCLSAGSSSVRILLILTTLMSHSRRTTLLSTPASQDTLTLVITHLLRVFVMREESGHQQTCHVDNHQEDHLSSSVKTQEKIFSSSLSSASSLLSSSSQQLLPLD